MMDSLYKQGSSPYLPSQKQSAGCSAGSVCLVRRHEESSFKSVFVLCTEMRCVLQYKPLSYALRIPGTKTLRGAWCQHTGLDSERIVFIAEVTFGYLWGLELCYAQINWKSWERNIQDLLVRVRTMLCPSLWLSQQDMPRMRSEAVPQQDVECWCIYSIFSCSGVTCLDLLSFKSITDACLL